MKVELRSFLRLGFEGVKRGIKHKMQRGALQGLRQGLERKVVCGEGREAGSLQFIHEFTRDVKILLTSLVKISSNLLVN